MRPFSPGSIRLLRPARSRGFHDPKATGYGPPPSHPSRIPPNYSTPGGRAKAGARSPNPNRPTPTRCRNAPPGGPKAGTPCAPSRQPIPSMREASDRKTPSKAQNNPQKNTAPGHPAILFLPPSSPRASEPHCGPAPNRPEFTSGIGMTNRRKTAPLPPLPTGRAAVRRLPQTVTGNEPADGAPAAFAAQRMKTAWSRFL
jgi:hypothetical protein